SPTKGPPLLTHNGPTEGAHAPLTLKPATNTRDLSRLTHAANSSTTTNLPPTHVVGELMPPSHHTRGKPGPTRLHPTMSDPLPPAKPLPTEPPKTL
ncbi:hypothetical protein GNI_112710, partial [Gregarina niphandrodes]